MLTIFKANFLRDGFKKVFRLFISRFGTSKKVIAADGLLELLAKGKHKLCSNCYELFTVSFVWYLASNHSRGAYQPIVFCFVCFFKNTIKNAINI